MAFHARSLFSKIFIFGILFTSTTLQLATAMRPLHGEQRLKKKHYIPMLEKLPKGPVPPSGPSPCTYIPGQGSGHCALNEKNFAGRVVHAPPMYPSAVIDLAAASEVNDLVTSS